jgi:hypothetical protein
MAMQFKNKQALDQFLSCSRVATFRQYPYKAGQNIIINKRYRARVSKVLTQPSFTTIRRYTKISGFKTATEWITVAQELHGEMPDYLVIVVSR